MRLSSGSAPSRAPRAFASGARLCPARSRGYLLSRMAITLHPRSLEETVDALRTTVFGKVEETELRSIAAEAAWVGLEAGETLFTFQRQGVFRWRLVHLGLPTVTATFR